MRIIFFGTPDFAAKCLEELIKNGHEILTVVTRQDKPVGRKMIMTPSAVKACALSHGLNVVTPASLKNGEYQEEFAEMSPDIFVVVAYGKLLPEALLSVPEFGAVNVHASVLPKYRGASPVQSALLAGEKETGVTIMRLDAGMDTGDIITQEKTPVGDDDNAEILFDRLADMGARLLCETLDLIKSGQAEYKKQDNSAATYTTMITKEMGRIDFNKSADDIFNTVRAFSPWPSAYTDICGKRVKILRSVKADMSGRPGEVLESSGRLIIACGSGAIEFLTLVPQGKKPMSAAEYLNGNKIAKGTFICE